MRRVPGALLIGILRTTVLATVLNELRDDRLLRGGIATMPDKVVSAPDFALVGNFSLHFVSALGAAARSPSSSPSCFRTSSTPQGPSSG